MKEKADEKHYTVFLLGIVYSWMELCVGQDSNGQSILDRIRSETKAAADEADEAVAVAVSKHKHLGCPTKS